MENILENIIDGFNSWIERILDIEERLKKITNIQTSVLDSLNRQVLDGLLSEQDSRELEYGFGLWLNLYKAVYVKLLDRFFQIMIY